MRSPRISEAKAWRKPGDRETAVQRGTRHYAYETENGRYLALGQKYREGAKSR